MSKFKVALFDLDGTILNTEDQYSIFWGNIGKEYHPEISDFEKIIKGTTLNEIFSKYFPDPNLQLRLTERLNDWEDKMKYEYIGGAKEYVMELKANGVKCAVVTSSNEKKMKNVERSLPEFNTLFDRILTAEMFSASKPDPDCYLLGARVFGAITDECIVFEDALTGIEAGRRAGMFTIGLATTNSRENISGMCNAVFDDFTTLDYDKTLILSQKERTE